MVWCVASLPSRPLRSTCTSLPDDTACTLHTQPRCNFLPGNDSPQGSEITIASADFKCMPGQPSGPSLNGQQLVIGLTELVYNKAYNSCIPDATADYRLPDLTHRQPDSTICAADPFNMTVGRHQMLTSFHLQLASVGQHVWIGHADDP